MVKHWTNLEPGEGVIEVSAECCDIGYGCMIRAVHKYLVKDHQKSPSSCIHMEAMIAMQWHDARRVVPLHLEDP